MDDLLVEIPGAEIATYGSCGTIASHWLNRGSTVCGSYAHVHSKSHLTPAVTRGTGPTPQLAKLLKNFNPTHLIIELGTNYGPIVAENGNTLSTHADINALLEHVRGNQIKCFWISLPDSRKIKPQVKAVLDETERTVQNTCIFFDSTRVTSYPPFGGDGLHYRLFSQVDLREMATNWAQSAFHAFLWSYFPDLEGRP